MTFREFEPGICRFSESPEITESDMSICESVSNAIASSHNLPKSSKLSMPPFRTSTPFFGHENRRKTSSSGSDSCYSELEMHLKKRHDCLSHNEASGSAASSKCVYVDDDLCHPMHEPHHPTHRRSAPPKEPFFRSERVCLLKHNVWLVEAKRSRNDCDFTPCFVLSFVILDLHHPSKICVYLNFECLSKLQRKIEPLRKH